MNRLSRSVLGLLALATLLGVPSTSRAADRQMTATERYEYALRLMRRGSTTKALEEFQRVRNHHRDDPVSVKAQLAIADLHFKKGDYDEARFAYEEFASYHPRHEYLDYVTWRIGFSIYKRAPKLAGRDQSTTKGAVNTWTGFETRFPDSEYRDDVEKLASRSRDRLAAKELWVAKFYRNRGEWAAVRGRAEGLLRRYPTSRHAPEALVLLGTAHHAWGDVDKAQAVRERLAADFPDSGALARLDRVLARAPGAPPEDETFIRPYHIVGMGQQPGF